jgi:hypothetical protein
MVLRCQLRSQNKTTDLPIQYCTSGFVDIISDNAHPAALVRHHRVRWRDGRAGARSHGRTGAVAALARGRTVAGARGARGGGGAAALARSHGARWRGRRAGAPHRAALARPPRWRTSPPRWRDHRAGALHRRAGATTALARPHGRAGAGTRAGGPFRAPARKGRFPNVPSVSRGGSRSRARASRVGAYGRIYY